MIVKQGLAPLMLALASCAGQAEQAKTPSQLVELNHVFATVDGETAEAVRASAVLRRFANMEVRTTTGTRATWTGRYLYGRQTYIEFFAPDDYAIRSKPAPVGTWGIALSGDRPGFTAILERRLATAGHKALIEVETRKLGDRDVPWFTALTAVSKHGDSGALDATVSAWSMEYLPSYFDLPEANKEAAEGSDDVISRERYQSDLYATRLMRDIVEIHLNISHRDFARIEPLLRGAGYRIIRSAGAAFVDGRECDFRFSLTPAREQGPRQIRFALNSAVGHRRTERIGNSTLAIGPNATATWTFVTPR